MFVSLDKVVEELKKNKFSHILSEKINIKANEITDLALLKRSWDYLPIDPYMKKGDTYRRRCFGKFIVDIANKTIDFVDDNIFFQSSEINCYAGGIERKLPQMSDIISSNVILRKIIENTLNAFLMYKKKKSNIWDVFVHQFRIESKKGIQGNPTPEGIHKDGHTFISMHMIGRYNIEGGTSYIYDENRNKIKEIVLEENLESILLDDMEMYHSAFVISSINDKKGFRDLMVIDYREKRQ
ncbi:2OG-Fe dioxygenase family protein [Bartonella sp. AU55XJBT]|uniref:2OG-Fe dioxygenase family protein n=1 Tax=Bartonella sp. AU55XJBT TaxID=3019091 RepID=UPI0023600621|nr:2OG-Fe dioxygenase family protein [Bartonella sp. AU55XJBT]